MIKIFEPFQPKIQLHIDTGFLQSLWDKYVPVSSKSYDHISLIYLKTKQDMGQNLKGQVQLLVNLILKNHLVQLNLSQNKILFNQSAVNHNFTYMKNYYFEQLKRMDLQIYRFLKQYITDLEREEEESKRYKDFQKIYQNIYQMQEEYQILYDFSLRLRELTTVKMIELEKSLGKELFRSFGKKEYNLLSEAFIWTEKKRVEEYIQNCSKEKFQIILKRLQKEKEWYSLLEDAKYLKKNIETQAEQVYAIPEQEKELENIEYVYAQSENILINIPEKILRNQLILLVETFHQEELRKFYQKILFLERNLEREETKFFQTDIIWKNTKKDINRQFELLNEKEIHYFWERFPEFLEKTCQLQQDMKIENESCYDACIKLKKQLEKIQKKYLTKSRTYLQEKVLQKETLEEYKTIADIIKLQDVVSEAINETIEDIVSEEVNKNIGDRILEEVNKNIEDRILEEVEQNIVKIEFLDFWNYIQQLEQKVIQRLQSQKEEIIQLERNVLEKYQNIFSLKELISLLQLQVLDSRIQKNENKEEFLPILESDTSSYKTTLFQIKQLLRKGYKEEQISEETVKELWTWGEVLLLHLVPESEKIQEHKISEEHIELQKLLEQINSQIQGTNFHLLYHEDLFKDTSIQNLLTKIRHIDRKEYQEIVHQLSDVILLLQYKKNYSDKKDVDFSWFEHTILLQKYGEQQLSEEFLGKLQKWSETLSAYAVRKLGENGTDFIFRNQQLEDKNNIQEKLKLELNVTKDKAEIQDIQQQIETSKEENELQYIQQQIEISKEENELQYIQQQIEISKEEIELQQLINQINYQIQETGIQLEYQEKQLKDTSIQSLLTQIRNIEKKEYQEIIHQLSDRILLLQYTKQEFKNQNILTQKYKVEQLSEKSINEFREWGEALLVHPTQNINENQIEIFSENQQFENENNLNENNLQEKLTMKISQQQDKKIKKLTELQYIQQQVELSKERAELKKLIYQINHNIQKTNIQISYREEQLKNISIKNLLTKLRETNETEYKKIVYQLSDMILLLKQEEHSSIMEKDILEEEITAQQPAKQKDNIDFLDYAKQKEHLEHIILIRKYGKQKLSEESISELKKLGEILLPHLKRLTNENDSEVTSNNQPLNIKNYVQENFPVEFIQRQVSKEQAELQKLIYQINHQIRRTEIQLEYQEEYLKISSLKSLITRISKADKQEYQKLVHQLSDVILLLQSKRKQLEIIFEKDSMQKFLNKKLFYIRQADNRKIDRAYPKFIYHIQIYEERRRTEKKNNMIQLGKNTKLWQQLLQQAVKQKETIREQAIQQQDLMQQLPIMQQEIAQRQAVMQQQEIVPIMQQQEIAQRKTVIQQQVIQEQDLIQQEAIIQQQDLIQQEAIIQQQDLIQQEAIIQQQDLIQQEAITTQKKTIQEHTIMQQEMEHWQQMIEKYSPLQHANIDKITKNDLQKKEASIQQETIKIETLHQQLDVRLKDLENKLEKIEDYTYTKENIRDITEKVKRQLQEELHLERLRRGLV